jgi:hypothetical protein
LNSAPWRKTRCRPAAPRFRPQLEKLEDRIVPSQIDLTVSSLADSGTGTLRAAIQTADMDNHSSDKFTIGFAPDLFTSGVTSKIELQSPLPDLNNSIAIQGPEAASLTVERASGVPFTSAIVTVDAGQTASLSGLTIANGNATGIANEGGTLTVSGCTISGNSGNNGGGIANDHGTLTISGCTISGNTVSNVGGGILNIGTLTVSTSTLSRNGVGGNAGGGIENFGTLTLTNCTVADNFAAVGGGIFNLGLVTIQQNSTLSGNTATSGGGILNTGTVTVLDSTLSGNSATGFDFNGFHVVGRGGGIYNFGVVTIQDGTLSGNTAEIGGGIDNEAFGTLGVRGSTFSGNTASDSGGGLYNLGTATVQESSFSGNVAGSDGGGIFNGATATLTLDDSLVWANLASLLGADLYNLGKVALNDSAVGVIGP